MSLKERLLEDMKSAMKNKQTIQKNTLQMARAAVLQIEKDSKVSLDDDGVIEVISKEVKKRKDSLPEYEKSGRTDLIDTLKEEIDTLMTYLPEQLSDKEVEELVQQAIHEIGATSPKEIGKIMQLVLPKIKGRADGKIVNLAVKKFLT